MNSLKDKHNMLLKKLLDKHHNNVFCRDGHFYSPIVDIKEFKQEEKRIFSEKEILDIIIDAGKQKELFTKLQAYYLNHPWKENPQKNFRYFFGKPNEAFNKHDGLTLFSMIMRNKPNKIIEVGSGFSSALMLDTNEHYFSNKIDLTFIEPYPVSLKKKLRDEDYENITLFEKKVQHIDIDIFKKLEENDILFIDSSHVSKVGSDVNFLFFEVLPRLKKGVVVHFHDIFYQFEYPKEWILQKRSWNENYILRAFLMYNDSFRIEFFNNYCKKTNPDALGYFDNFGGSIWLRKIR